MGDTSATAARYQNPASCFSSAHATGGDIGDPGVANASRSVSSVVTSKQPSGVSCASVVAIAVAIVPLFPDSGSGGIVVAVAPLPVDARAMA